MLKIRALTPDDIDYVTDSVNREKWGYTRSDVHRCYLYEPEGWFIAESEGKPVGHVFSISYGKLGWIGLLVVDRKHRLKGIGATLMNTAIEYLKKRNVQTIKLEAVPEAVNFYRQLGFTEEFDSLRLRLSLQTQTRGEGAEKTETTTVRPLQKNDVSTLVKFDQAYFGANREKVLTNLLNDFPQHCFIAEDGEETVGYIMARETASSYMIAPWICIPQKASVAVELFQACRASLGTRHTEIRVGTPAANKTAISQLHSLGFETYSKSIRMRLGANLTTENVKGVFAIAGPHKG